MDKEMSVEVKERRRTERYPFPASVVYTKEKGDTSTLCRGITRDISRTGACMYVFDEISEGQDIFLQEDHPVIRGRARVQWITELEPSFYMAGLKFLK